MEQGGWKTARQRCYGRRDKWKTIEVSYDVGEKSHGRSKSEGGSEGGRESVRGLSLDTE